MGGDLRERVDQFADDYDLSSHKAGLRAMDRGLQTLGYSENEDAEAQTAAGKAAGAAAIPLVVAGFVFAVASSMPPELAMYTGSVLLACGVVALLVERAEPVLSDKLGVPKTKQHPDALTDTGDD